ncbi:MAG: hypothetical protein BRC33_06160 [Cyanobacteria bacterium SW_9_44_58]|nr:MAG: hypothetical protein BRC33_06160 [Cyanobacteria bacterium SW_9_44_58]
MTVSNRPQSIESDVDQMINSLFQEIDQMLEQGNHFQSDTEKNKQNVALDKTETSDAKAAKSWGHIFAERRPNQSSHPLLKPASEEFVSFPDFVDEDYCYQRESEQLPLWIRHLDKIVFSSSCSLFLGILFFLQKEEQWAEFSVTQLSNQITLSKISNQPAIDTDQKFLSYMERALAEINQEKKQAQQQEAKKRTDSASSTGSTQAISSAQSINCCFFSSCTCSSSPFHPPAIAFYTNSIISQDCTFAAGKQCCEGKLLSKL